MMAQFAQRHYITIATVINKSIRISHEEKLIGSKATALLIQKLIDTFEQDNSKFKKELFMKTLADGTTTIRRHPVINQLEKLQTENKSSV
jgi:hypothetical protein